MPILMTFNGAKILMEIEKNIKEGTFSKRDLSELSRFLGVEILTFDESIAKEFLTVLSKALCAAKLCKTTRDWTHYQGAYFSNNMKKDKNTFYPHYKKLFLSEKFDLNDIVDLLNDIINDFNGSRNDYYLRIPEVILRDDVKIDASNLKTLSDDIGKIISKC